MVTETTVALPVVAPGRRGPQAASRGHWLVLATVLVIGSITAAVLLRIDEHVLTYYGDAASHLLAGRKLVDWGDDLGIGRFGTAWLPLPHLLLLPFTLNGVLFTTGLAGTAVSLPCLALTAAYLYRIIREQLGGPAHLAAAGALLYALNPNILYLGLIAMTEAPFMLLFVAAAFYFGRWYQTPDDLRSLGRVGALVALATLCRYEGWILPLFLVPVALVVLFRAPLSSPRKLAGAALAALSGGGALLWMGYNALAFGDPMEFNNAEFYSASWQALTRDVRETLIGQPINVLAVYGTVAFTIYGPVLLTMAALGLVQRVWRGRARGPDARPLLAFLAMPPLFTLFTLLIGIGELSYWFNARFLVLASPVLILLAARFVQGQRRPSLRGPVAVAVGLAVWLAGHAVLMVLDRVPTYLDARGGFFYHLNPSTVAAGEQLRSTYDGGKIMIMTGSAQAHRIMLTAGVPLGQYDDIVASSTWKKSYAEPWRYDRWLVLSRDPDSDAEAPAAAWAARRDELSAHYETVYENDFYEILRRTDR